MLNGQLNVAPSVCLFSAELRPEHSRQKRRLGRASFNGGSPGLGGGEAASVLYKIVHIFFLRFSSGP
jgi:hypothetical protein